MTPLQTVLAVTCLSLVLSGCGRDEQTPPASSSTAGPGATAGAATGADDEACRAGGQQSPIDLSPGAADADADLPPVTFDYSAATYEVENRGQTLRATAEGGGSMTIGDEHYELVHLSARTPSEHALDGERSDGEVHLVHESEQGDVAVVGVLVDGLAGDFPLSWAWSRLPDERGETARLPNFDASLLIPDDPTLYRYDGSLTTAPCAEGVRWLVVGEPVRAPASLVDAVRDILGDTARPLQPVGDREVSVSEG